MELQYKLDVSTSETNIIIAKKREIKSLIERGKVTVLVCMCVCMYQLIVNALGAPLTQQQQCIQKKRQILSDRTNFS